MEFILWFWLSAFPAGDSPAMTEAKKPKPKDEGIEICIRPVEQPDGSTLWVYGCEQERGKKKH